MEETKSAEAEEQDKIRRRDSQIDVRDQAYITPHDVILGRAEASQRGIGSLTAFIRLA